MGVHVKNQFTAAHVDENGNGDWCFILHYADGNEPGDYSPGWADSAMKALVDDAIAAQSLSDFDTAVQNRLPSNAASWYAAKATGRRDKLWASTKKLAAIR